METSEKCATLCVIVLFCATIALICASVTTDYWFVASVYRKDDNTTVVGTVHGGLFLGHRQLDYGLGKRSFDFPVSSEQAQQSLVSRPIWITILVCIGVSVCANVCGIVLMLTRFCQRCECDVLGGVYACAVMSCCSTQWVCPDLSGTMPRFAVTLTTTIVIAFLDQFIRRIAVSVLTPSVEQQGFSTANTAQLEYSFWLVFAATCNSVIIVVVLIGDNYNFARIVRFKRAAAPPPRVGGDMSLVY